MMTCDGFQCCNKPTSVIETRSRIGYVRRRRICTVCDKRLTTFEIASNQMETMRAIIFKVSALLDALDLFSSENSGIRKLVDKIDDDLLNKRGLYTKKEKI